MNRAVPALLAGVVFIGALAFYFLATDGAPEQEGHGSTSAQEDTAHAGQSGVAEASVPTAAGAFATWHRHLGEPATREHLEMADAGTLAMFDSLGAAVSSASEFAGWMNRHDASAFGAEFARIGSAFAAEGILGLEKALAEGAGSSPARLFWSETLATEAAAQGRFAAAAVGWRLLIPGMFDAGYSRERLLRIATPLKALSESAQEFLPWREYVVVPGDSLERIRMNLKAEGVQVSAGWIRDFNRRYSDRIRVGEQMRIPEIPLRIEIHRQMRLLVVFAADQPLWLYPVSVGMAGHETPLGEFTIASHEFEPTYWPQDNSPSLPYGNPENPLGSRWLGFQEDSQYGVHGSRPEEPVGGFASLGCVRMENADVEKLYDRVPNGTKVLILP